MKMKRLVETLLALVLVSALAPPAVASTRQVSHHPAHHVVSVHTPLGPRGFGEKFPILTISLAGDGLGSVWSTPSGIWCPSVCSHSFAFGTLIYLGLYPNSSSEVGMVSDICSSTLTGSDVTMSASGCAFRLTKNTKVTVEFSLVGVNRRRRVRIRIFSFGSGMGMTSINGVGCMAACSVIASLGDTLNFNANPSPGSRFAGWSGGVCSGTGPCSVMVSGPMSVGAEFIGSQPTLTVRRFGHGQIVSVPDGIACGRACTQVFDGETIVALVAHPARGYHFVGWGGACHGRGECFLDITGATVVRARFNKN